MVMSLVSRTGRTGDGRLSAASLRFAMTAFVSCRVGGYRVPPPGGGVCTANRFGVLPIRQAADLGLCNNGARYRPVKLAFDDATSSGVPSAIIWPPPAPPSG